MLSSSRMKWFPTLCPLPTTRPVEQSSMVQPDEENISLAPCLQSWATETRLHFSSGTKNAPGMNNLSDGEPIFPMWVAGSGNPSAATNVGGKGSGVRSSKTDGLHVTWFPQPESSNQTTGSAMVQGGKLLLYFLMDFVCISKFRGS
jgi:uncharacterized protein (UPF0210 family)